MGQGVAAAARVVADANAAVVPHQQNQNNHLAFAVVEQQLVLYTQYSYIISLCII